MVKILKKSPPKHFIYLSGDFFVIYIIKLFGHVLILAIAGQTAGPNWLKLFQETKTSKIDFQICLPKCFFLRATPDPSASCFIVFEENTDSTTIKS